MNGGEDCSFVHTGPDTIGGRYLRSFWQPVYESDKLAPGHAVPIHIMNESFTLYRGENGRAQVVDFRCAHRNTQLSTGWVEGDDIRCLYHGWKYDATGQCLEQPAEANPFCHKIKIGAYPTEEQLGFVFVYFGKDPCPPFQRWPEFETEEAVSSMAMIPCNYFQSAENILDDVHVAFAHRTFPELRSFPHAKKPPTVAAEETSYGIRVSYSADEGVDFTHFLMPNLAYVSYVLSYFKPKHGAGGWRMQSLFWYVPIDDVSHQHFTVTIGHRIVTHKIRQDRNKPHSVAEDIKAVLSGQAEYHKELQTAKRRPDILRIQDGVLVVGQGQIVDRTRERLGTSDAGVILLRKTWSRELRALANGDSLTAFSRPAELPG